jgi:hypothetical protein
MIIITIIIITKQKNEQVCLEYSWTNFQSILYANHAPFEEI